MTEAADDNRRKTFEAFGLPAEGLPPQPKLGYPADTFFHPIHQMRKPHSGKPAKGVPAHKSMRFAPKHKRKK